MKSTIIYTVAASIGHIALISLPIVSAHRSAAGSEELRAHGQGHGQGAQSSPTPEDTEYPPTYFAHHEHVALLYTHVGLMILAWVIVLPIAVMVSLARSRYTLPVQFVFMASNILGILLAIIYNGRTPDLYPDNAHHKVGWIVTGVVTAQICLGTLRWISGATHRRSSHFSLRSRNDFIALPGEDEESNSRQSRGSSDGYRYSRIGQQESEPSADSSQGSAASTVIDDGEGLPVPSPQTSYDVLEPMMARRSCPRAFWKTKATSVVSSRVWQYLELAYKLIDCIILPLGFVVVASGIATLGRFFEGKAIFNGMAHWVKGGVFFWLGLFNLARWSGSFGALGWAWNVRPKLLRDKWRPSAEFVESALIFFYGSTNIFMEHLSNWGGKWTVQDLEHLSITVLFIGGGLCGMLIESTRIRKLLNVPITETVAQVSGAKDKEQEYRQDITPSTYDFSLNPIPALVILLVGIMMSSHHQQSMISTMIHKQWGNLLVGASFARGLTYVLVFLRPPTSVLPSRPPAELLASFGLIAGGIMFMASSADIVKGMTHYELDPMFMYTVTMGLVGLLMAWEIVVLAIGGLATRRERRAVAHHLD